LCQILSESIAF